MLVTAIEDGVHRAIVISQMRRKLKDGTARAQRLEMRLPQEELARAAGISRAAIAAYESGRRSPRAAIALKLAVIFDALERAS